MDSSLATGIKKIITRSSVLSSSLPSVFLLPHINPSCSPSASLTFLSPFTNLNVDVQIVMLHSQGYICRPCIYMDGWIDPCECFTVAWRRGNSLSAVNRSKLMEKERKQRHSNLTDLEASCLGKYTYCI